MPRLAHRWGDGQYRHLLGCVDQCQAFLSFISVVLSISPSSELVNGQFHPMPREEEIQSPEGLDLRNGHNLQRASVEDHRSNSLAGVEHYRTGVRVRIAHHAHANTVNDLEGSLEVAEEDDSV